MKTYPSIHAVTAFGQGPAPGPLVDTLSIFAVVGAPASYPAARISLAHPDIGSLSLTTEQSLALRERLEQAERNIDAAEPCENGGTLTDPARCDCCGRAMAVGEHVAVHWDERKGDVVMHAGECPEPEMWMVAYRWDGIPTTGFNVRPRPYEEAFAYARHLAEAGASERGTGITNVRLVRVRGARP